MPTGRRKRLHIQEEKQMNNQINPEFARIMRQIENLHQAMIGISTEIGRMTGTVFITDIVKSLGHIKDIANMSKGIQDKFSALLAEGFMRRDQEANRLARELELMRKIFPNPDAGEDQHPGKTP